jgi:hydroxymethylpyrimidine/phosphomethylpyrimidine kinase
LLVGGLDPSAGAGLAADLRAVALAGGWGCPACAALTVQSTRGVRSVTAVSTRLLGAQVEEILGDVAPRVVKTGALGSPGNVRWVARRLGAAHGGRVLVVDPVLQPTRWRARTAAGARGGLSGGSAALAAVRELAAVASLLTPNVPEAETLLAADIATPADARDAAMALVARGAHAVLLKGGHLPSARPRSAGRCACRDSVVDWLATAAGVRRLERARLPGPAIHGTGCVLASLVAGRLGVALAARPARRRAAPLEPDELLAAACWARARLDRLMRRAVRLGAGAPVLGLGR